MSAASSRTHIDRQPPLIECGLLTFAEDSVVAVVEFPPFAVPSAVSVFECELPDSSCGLDTCPVPLTVWSFIVLVSSPVTTGMRSRSVSSSRVLFSGQRVPKHLSIL